MCLNESQTQRDVTSSQDKSLTLEPDKIIQPILILNLADEAQILLKLDIKEAFL